MSLASAFALACLVAACGPNTSGNSADAPPGGDACTGSGDRCFGAQFQHCTNGNWQTTETCTASCSATLGCVECDPTQGANTCNGNAVVTCTADGHYGTVVESCQSGQTCVAGTCTRACTADGVDLIYVIDEQHNLLSFDPRNLTSPTAAFHLIGQPQCTPGPILPAWATQSGDTIANPFSMAVDRDAVAWVLYTSGEIFKVSTTDASCIGNTGYTVSQNGMDLFGMGFVTDTSGGNTEKLYLGGGDVSATPGGQFAIVDPAAPTTATVPPGSGLPNDGELSPELTGTGAAELFGFFPGVTTAFVQQLDKATGHATGGKWNIAGGLGGTVRAWAFAQWGGYFYIFVTTDPGSGVLNSTVRRINRQTMQYETVPGFTNLPYTIVGAGVSTCAPVVIGAPAPGEPPTAPTPVAH
ncbi:MAG: hypothetical protein K8W52_34985 [Deltaproteobacteria bacterium]|nr:hypothetical protein [Deltaproteobacteria bacterium]